jgi:ATP-binding cassette subfamily F protein 3
VVTRISDLHLRKLIDYVGNYSRYVEQRDAMLERLRQAKREQDEEVARVKMFIDRFRYQATKAAQVQSRIKLLEKVVPIEVPPERKRIHFKFPTCAKSGRTVLELKHARKAYGDLVVFRDLTCTSNAAIASPSSGQRRRQVDADADAVGRRAPDRGTRTVGHQVVMEYFAQDEATRLNPTLTVYETLEVGSATDMVPAIRNISVVPVLRRRCVQEGGGALGRRAHPTRSRAHAAPSLEHLLLDEPTNHLDLDSKDVLLEALEDYGGTLVIVSHDRYFVEKLATKIIEIGHGQAIVYPGT